MVRAHQMRTVLLGQYLLKDVDFETMCAHGELMKSLRLQLFMNVCTVRK
jgi:hypothetical protein